MEVPRQYIGANVRLENNLGLASLKMPVKARNARHVISDYDSVHRPSLLTPSSGGRVGSKLGSDRPSIPFAVKGYLQLASPCTMHYFDRVVRYFLGC